MLRTLLRRTRRRHVFAAMLLVASIALANVPTTTNILVNYEPRTLTQPLYAKMIDFVNRDMQMRQLAGRIVANARTEEQKVERLLQWTTTNIRPTPPGLPAVDDHPYNTIVRGYGDPDQAADVLAILAAYLGIPGGLFISRASDGSMLYAFTVLRIAGADRLFDVREGLGFRDRTGALAALDDLRRDPSVLSQLPPPRAAAGTPYTVLIERLETGPHRRPTDQMPLPRLMAELARLLGR